MTRVRPPGAATIFILALLAAVACTSGEPSSSTPVQPSSAPASAADPRTIEPTSEGASPITIAAVGDLMLARDIAVLMETEGPLYPFERVLPLFEDADLLIGNLEGTFTERGTALDKQYTFRTPPALAQGLALAGFDAVSIANNHSFDFGVVGLSDTLDALEAAGVTAFGGGLDEVAAYSPAMFEVHGQTVAFLGFNAIGGTRAAGGDDPGVAWADARGLAAVADASRSADFVVVMVHAGVEYSADPSEEQSAFARGAIDAGADIVIGHHPHALQPWESYGAGVILNSLGNFVFDLDAGDLEDLGSAPFQSAVALITLSANAQPEVVVRPAYIDVQENRPRPATIDERASIVDRVGTRFPAESP